MAAEKILNESILSWNFDNAVQVEMQNQIDLQPKEEEPVHLGPSISGAIENFVARN